MIAHADVLAIVVVVAVLLLLADRLRRHPNGPVSQNGDGGSGGTDTGFMFGDSSSDSANGCDGGGDAGCDGGGDGGGD
jgi:hypothetical protein